MQLVRSMLSTALVMLLIIFFFFIYNLSNLSGFTFFIRDRHFSYKAANEFPMVHKFFKKKKSASKFKKHNIRVARDKHSKKLGNGKLKIWSFKKQKKKNKAPNPHPKPLACILSACIYPVQNYSFP